MYFLGQFPSEDFYGAAKLTSQREITPFLFHRSYSKAERIKHWALKAELQLLLSQGETDLRIRMGRSSEGNLPTKRFRGELQFSFPALQLCRRLISHNIVTHKLLLPLSQAGRTQIAFVFQ